MGEFTRWVQAEWSFDLGIFYENGLSISIFNQTFTQIFELKYSTIKFSWVRGCFRIKYFAEFAQFLALFVKYVGAKNFVGINFAKNKVPLLKLGPLLSGNSSNGLNPLYKESFLL